MCIDHMLFTYTMLWPFIGPDKSLKRKIVLLIYIQLNLIYHEPKLCSGMNVKKWNTVDTAHLDLRVELVEFNVPLDT